MLSLNFANANDDCIVLRVAGKDNERKHLSDLGFVEGAKIHIISNHNGDVIAEIKDSKLAITREMAMKIFINLKNKNERIAN